MITDGLLSFLTSIASGLLAPLGVVDIAVDIVTSIPVVSKFVMFVVYVIPWSNLVPLFVIIFAIMGIRVGIAVIKFILGLLPFLGS